MKKDELMKLFSLHIRNILFNLKIDYEKLQEIRLRINAPLIICYDGKEYFITEMGEKIQDPQRAYIVSKKEIAETLEYIGNYSLYAFEDEVRQGFITVQGGHRIGIAGKTVLEGDHIKNMKYISFLNVRISHQIKGCADSILPYVIKNGEICHTLIISPPKCGKTTILRDMIRQLSNGSREKKGVSVGVVDERSELSGSYLGVPQNDLGIRTDVLDCCPKAEGMMMLIRSMAPDVVAVDEIGDYRDVQAIEAVLHCGCKLLATVHGSSMEDIMKKPLIQKMINDKVFERYIVLHNRSKIGQVKAIYDERGSTLLYNSVQKKEA